MNILAPLTLVECMPKDENGHMHLFVGPTATVTTNGLRAGTVSMDAGCDLLLTIDDARYHIKALEIWQAVYDALERRKALPAPLPAPAGNAQGE